MIPILHIFDQTSWHDDVIIAGNEKGFRNLYEALGRILDPANTVELSKVFVNDREGYDIVLIKEKDSTKLDKLMVPYTAEYAMDVDETHLTPYNLINEDEYQKKMALKK